MILTPPFVLDVCVCVCVLISVLLRPQTGGVPLSRGALITHCYTDLSFMDFICSLVTNAVQVTTRR